MTTNRQGRSVERPPEWYSNVVRDHLTPAQADALTDALRSAAEQGDHVTSDQFKAGQAEVRAEIAEVLTEIANLDTRLSTQMSRIEADLEVRHEAAQVRVRAGRPGALIKLVFFPAIADRAGPAGAGVPHVSGSGELVWSPSSAAKKESSERVPSEQAAADQAAAVALRIVRRGTATLEGGRRLRAPVRGVARVRGRGVRGRARGAGPACRRPLQAGGPAVLTSTA